MASFKPSPKIFVDLSCEGRRYESKGPRVYRHTAFALFLVWVAQWVGKRPQFVDLIMKAMKAHLGMARPLLEKYRMTLCGHPIVFLLTF